MNALQKLQQRYGSGEGRALYELILSQRFGLSRTDILLGKDTTLSAEKQAELQIIVDRVVKGEPVQYVLGCEEFCEHEFLVGPGVLIPRPETQQLVHLVEQNVAPGSTVLDVGTGSGCIAITLALAGYKVTALDVSDEALAIAKFNGPLLSATLLTSAKAKPRRWKQTFSTTNLTSRSLFLTTTRCSSTGQSASSDGNILQKRDRSSLR